MAQIKHITTDDERPDPTEGIATLEDDLAAARDHMAQVRAQRVAARGDDVPPAERRRILADTDQAYAQAIADVDAAERRLARATRRAGRAQTVKVGAARQGSKARNARKES